MGGCIQKRFRSLKGTLHRVLLAPFKESYQRVSRDLERGAAYFARYYVAMFEHTGLTK